MARGKAGTATKVKRKPPLSRPCSEAELALLEGIVLPERQRKGAPVKGIRDAWLVVVERLMVRGANTPYLVSRLCQMGYDTAVVLIEDVRKKWRSAVTEETLAEMRAELAQRTRAVEAQSQGWANAAVASGDKARHIANVLKAQKQEAALYGLASMKITIEGTGKLDEALGAAQSMTPADFVQKYGLTPDRIRQIAHESADGMSSAARATIDAELVEDKAETAAAKAERGDGDGKKA